MSLVAPVVTLSFFFSSRRRHTRCLSDWSSDVCSSDLNHKGYVFSNAWVHQTVEAMSIALMIDPQGDPEIVQAQEKMRATLEDWIPKILAAQEPDGYLQTAFTLDRPGRNGNTYKSSEFKHWDPAHRGDHEGYTAGYFLESAINHYLMTNKQDARMYNAAKKLADCWCANLGPAPKKTW